LELIISEKFAALAAKAVVVGAVLLLLLQNSNFD
jgi:hypothetical protein